jgi:hypothetical protein
MCSLTRYNSVKASPNSSERTSSSKGRKYIGNSETFTSPSTPSSSRILFDTNVLLGTQNMDISCSTEPFFCNLLICSVLEALVACNVSDISKKDSKRPIRMLAVRRVCNTTPAIEISQRARNDLARGRPRECANTWRVSTVNGLNTWSIIPAVACTCAGFSP